MVVCNSIGICVFLINSPTVWNLWTVTLLTSHHGTYETKWKQTLPNRLYQSYITVVILLISFRDECTLTICMMYISKTRRKTVSSIIQYFSQSHHLLYPVCTCSSKFQVWQIPWFSCEKCYHILVACARLFECNNFLPLIIEQAVKLNTFNYLVKRSDYTCIYMYMTPLLESQCEWFLYWASCFLLLFLPTICLPLYLGTGSCCYSSQPFVCHCYC